MQPQLGDACHFELRFGRKQGGSLHLKCIQRAGQAAAYGLQPIARRQSAGTQLSAIRRKSRHGSTPV